MAYQNGLCLSPDKVDVIVFGTSKWLANVPEITSICVVGTDVTVSSKIETLGVTLDSCLTLNDHVTAVCGLCCIISRLSITSGHCLLLLFLLLLQLHTFGLTLTLTLYNTTAANPQKPEKIQNTLAKAIFLLILEGLLENVFITYTGFQSASK
jgi:hypothetical protein